MAASTACLTCNANWDNFINNETLALKFSKESGDKI